MWAESDGMVGKTPNQARKQVRALEKQGLLSISLQEQERPNNESSKGNGFLLEVAQATQTGRVFGYEEQREYS